MITLPQGFNVGSVEPVDARLVLTKAEMRSAKDGAMPSLYMALCKDDGLMYIYNKSNAIDEETGKYRPYGGGSNVSSESITSEQIQNLFKEGD